MDVFRHWYESWRDPDRPRRPRWGLRTLGFLALATLAMIMSSVSGGYTVGQFGSLVFGVVGAMYCSVKGIRAALERPLLPRGGAGSQSENGHAPSGPTQS